MTEEKKAVEVQSELNTVLLKTLYESNTGDIEVKTNGEFNRKLSSTILAIASPVFKSMFEHEMEEKRTKTLLIEDFDDKVVENFFGYLYYKKIIYLQDLSIEQQFQLLAMFDKYQIPDVVSACQKLIQTISPPRALECLLECKKYPDLTKDIYEKCIELLYQTYYVIIVRGAFTHINCYDSVPHNAFGKPKHHDFQMCCIHQHNDLKKVTTHSKAETNGPFTCTAWKLEGRSLEDIKKINSETNYCCYHRQYMDATKKTELPAIKKYQEFLQEKYKEFMTLPDDIRERVHHRMFFGIDSAKT